MALGLVSVASFSVLDTYGKRKSIPFYFPVATSVSAIQTAMDALISAYDDMSDAQVDAARVNLALTLPSGIKTAPSGGAHVNEGANTLWTETGISDKHGIFFPALSGDAWDGLTLASGAELTALIAAVDASAGPSGGLLTALVKNYFRTRK